MHFATDHQTGLQDLQDQHDEKRLTLIGSRQSEPPLGVRPETDSIKMSETAESFHEKFQISCYYLVLFSGWRRPGKRSHIYFLVSPRFE